MSGLDDPEYMKKVRKEAVDYFHVEPNDEDKAIMQASQDREKGISPEKRQQMDEMMKRKRALGMGGY